MNARDESSESPRQGAAQDSKRHKRISHETSFHGQVFGPVHTGSGNLEVDGLDYSKAGAQITEKQTAVLSAIPAPRNAGMQALVRSLPAKELNELAAALAQIDAT